MNINLLKHCCTCGVIAYKLLKEFGYPEDMCRKGYLLGYLHDCMKPFEVDELRNHGLLLSGLLDGEIIELIEKHEIMLESNEDYPTLLIALKFADYTVNSKGEFVGFDGRLVDVEERYGLDTTTYKDTLHDITWLRSRGYEVFEKKFLEELDIFYDTNYAHLN